jgi:hypothetical protein
VGEEKDAVPCRRRILGSRAATFDAELEHPSLHLMAVEEPDVVTLTGRLPDHGSDHQEKQEEL